MSTQEELENQLLAKYELELAAQPLSPVSGTMPYSSAMYAQPQKQNIVEWELDFKSELLDIERLLRCDIIVRDEKTGEETWARNPNAASVFMNDLGVNDVLRKIRLMVNKGKILSNYKIEEITVRVKMIENELRVLIYNNYEQYGIDNEYKMNNYSMTVLTIGSMIEDAYRRALGGEGHKGLNEQRMVQQSESIMPMGQYPMMGGMGGGMSKKHWYNPMSWFK